MDPNHPAATTLTPPEIVAHIDQKALRLSGLLRDIDNHPVPLSPELSSRLDEVLELLGTRVTATRALLHSVRS